MIFLCNMAYMMLWIKIRKLVDILAVLIFFCALIWLLSLGISLLPLIIGSGALAVQRIFAALFDYSYLRKTHNKSIWNALAQAVFSPGFFFWNDKEFLNAEKKYNKD